MKIGIDYTALQGPHRQRGIGSVLLNVLNALSDKDKDQHSFIFFVEPGTAEDPKLLDAIKTTGLNYTIKEFKPAHKIHKRLPGKFGLLTSAANNIIGLYHLRFGDSRLMQDDVRKIDAYFQIDPGQPMPKGRRGLTSALMLHDLIPYVLEWDYLWNYRTARRHGFSRKAALRVQARRMLYVLKYKAVIKNSNLLLANSEHTKNDFIKYFRIEPRKIHTTPLGIVPIDKHIAAAPPSAVYHETSWGYVKKKYSFDTTPFILFVGGADRRRKLEDAVAAFNCIRAKNIKLKLVLAGDSMRGPMTIATEEIQQALKTSSYPDDILYVGFAAPEALIWLYQNALAFVFPSRYEGFGLPVLEAMSYGTPTVVYNNMATREVAKDMVIYANDIVGLEQAITSLLIKPWSEAKKQAGIHHASATTWSKTAAHVIDLLQLNQSYNT